MKAVLVLLVLSAAAVLARPKAAAGSTYTTKYDNIDLQEILTNSRLYKKYFDCLVNRGKCTPDGKELKDNLPDALATDCAKCSQKQKEGTKTVLRYLLEKRPADYDILEKIYDPSGSYKQRFQAEAKKQGIKLPN